MADSLLLPLLYLLVTYCSTSIWGTVAESSKSAAEQCPKGLKGNVEVFQCKCYEFQKTQAVWDNKRCTVNGGHLAKIESAAVNDFVVEKAKKHLPEAAGAWIGAKRAKKGAPFYWTDGSAVDYTDWIDGEPDDLVLISQNCVYLKRTRFWGWATLQCDHLIFDQNIPAICQYDIHNCTTDSGTGALSTPILIGIVIGSVIGGLLLCLLVSCLIINCNRRCRKYQKKRRQQRSVRYYSRPPSAAVRQSTIEPRENDLNEQLVRGAEANAEANADDSDSVLNVKEWSLPTAASIAADAAASKTDGLVVDVQTGRSTVKRINVPNRSDNASVRTLKSFQMDPTDRVSQCATPSAQLGVDEPETCKISLTSSLNSDSENDGMLANLDNVDKPSSHPSKDIAYK